MRYFALCIALMALGQWTLQAQAADGSSPAASNVRGAQSPRIHADRSITGFGKPPFDAARGGVICPSQKSSRRSHLAEMLPIGG
jgi:hypothetical protein